MKTKLPLAHDQILFTPGPLTTSQTVRQAMLRDVGSWHGEFIEVVGDIRQRLLKLAGLSKENGWDVVLMQGSGTFGVEAVFHSVVPRDGRVAVITNGAYGERMIQMLSQAGVDHTVLRESEDTPASLIELGDCLASDKAVTHVAVVHCETTTGLLNPIEKIGQIVRNHDKKFIVDAMSSFGGMPIDFEKASIDYLISSANKCIEGVPGFSFVFCKTAELMKCAGYSRSLSLDLVAQLAAFEKDGKFRYTPPTHVLMAFQQALIEIEMEGGVAGRHERYLANHKALVEGMWRLGFEPYLNPSIQSSIITAFHYHREFEFNFKEFYEKLAIRGQVIYPGKLTRVNTFRIGNIGRIFPADMHALLAAIRDVLLEMGINISPLNQPLHVNLE